MWLLFVIISKRLTTSSWRSNIVYIWFQRHLRLTGVYVPCVSNTQRNVCQIVVISEKSASHLDIDEFPNYSFHVVKTSLRGACI